MSQINQEGIFWFPEDKSRSFPASISDEEELVIEISTLEESYFISQLIHDKGPILINGNTAEGKKVTSMILLVNKKPKLNFVAKTYYERLTFKIKWLFYNEHFDSSDIKFTGLIVNFTDINKWMTPSEIIFSESGVHRQFWELDINDSHLIRFSYGRPITDRDNATVDRIGENVYVRIESKKSNQNFEELLKEKHTFQDFLNFVITQHNVIPQSIYGIIKASGNEKLVEIRERFVMPNNVDKSRIRGPVLFHCRQYGEDRLAYLIKKWFEFKSAHEIIYNFYVDSLYKSESVELSYFKSVAFLEGYHRDIIEEKGESHMRRQRELIFKSILGMLEQADVEDGWINLVRDLLKRPEIKELTLGHRLRELFEPYKELISLNTVAVSFFKKDQLRKWVKKASVDEEANEKLSDVLEMKFAADSERASEKRKERYNEILNIFQSEQGKRLSLTFRMLLFVEHLLTEQFPSTFSKYRNAMAHLLRKDYEGSLIRWYYAFKIMQFTGQLCMLRMLGFEKKEIEDIFFLDKINYESRLRVIIEANIEA